MILQILIILNRQLIILRCTWLTNCRGRCSASLFWLWNRICARILTLIMVIVWFGILTTCNWRCSKQLSHDGFLKLGSWEQWERLKN